MRLRGSNGSTQRIEPLIRGVIQALVEGRLFMVYRIRCRTIAAGVLALLVLSVAFEPKARADGGPADIAAAEALFAEGKRLVPAQR